MVRRFLPALVLKLSVSATPSKMRPIATIWSAVGEIDQFLGRS